ncbi:MAG: hypothetical protein JOZ53_15980 [Planctomycetaceae bacterium]|nr:hypothetical protein [Planctomycetaceae bacterium]
MVTRLRVVGVLLLVLGGIAALMGRAEAFDPPPLLHSSLRSPVLAIELVRSADDARSVLRDPEGEHNRAVMRRLIDLDWSFIAAYALAFCGLGLVLRACRGPGARALGTLAIFGAGAAALGDVYLISTSAKLTGRSTAIAE